MSSTRRVTVHIDREIFSNSSSLSGQSIAAESIKHSLMNSPSANGLPCLAILWDSSNQMYLSHAPNTTGVDPKVK